jgi:hypothetical protein
MNRHPTIPRPGRGRPKGSPNVVTTEVRQLAQRLLSDPAYQNNLLERLRAGTLGSLEPVLWAYAFGRPKDHVELSVTEHEATNPQVVFYIPENGRDGNHGNH